MGKLTLYGLDPSPPVRACLLTLKALELPYEYIEIDLSHKENLSPEYLEKNPQHTVPTLDDGGHYIWDSHAIIAYLVSKYAKDDALYPKDLLKRALVDQRLHFDCGVIFQGGLRSITVPLFFRNQTQFPKQQIDSIVEIYNFLETFLRHHIYMAGDHLTIADFSIVSSVTSIEAFVGIDKTKFPKLKAWIKRLESLPYYEEANGKGCKQFFGLVKAKNFTIVS